VSTTDLTWRTAEPSDAEAVVAAITDWWPGVHMVHGVCPQLFEHFGDTCVIVEDDDGLIGFLVGFMSQRFPDAGYVHYAGVRPGHRGDGLGTEMYARFADTTRARGRSLMLAETGAWNVKIVVGVPVHRDTTGHGFDYVEMVWRLDGETGGSA
jgi:GNAT superfamily N-acetyltransferase